MSSLRFESFSPAQAVPEEAVLVGTYTNLFSSSRVDVLLCSQQGLSARVTFFDTLGKITNILESLPLAWMPKALTASGDVGLLKNFFTHTSLTPERGVQGLYNRVSVSVIGNGGGKSTIPFQPGLALGSVVKCDTLAKMERYSKKIAQQNAYEEQIKRAEQQIQALLSKINARKKELSPLPTKAGDPKEIKDDVIIDMCNAQIENLKVFIKNIGKKLLAVMAAEDPAAGKLPEEENEIPIFEGFQQGLASPIDMSASKIENQVRGFDSLQFNSQYINLRQDNAEIRNKIEQSSSASSISAKAGWALWGAGVTHTRSEAIASRVQGLQKSGKTEGVWIVNAMVTTRYVRSFTQITYDKQALQHILDAMKSNNSDLQKRFGISEGLDGKKEIYLLTEAVLGGSFTALVTFYDANTMQRNVLDSTKQQNNSTSVNVNGGYSLFSIGAGGSHASGSASKSEEDVLNSLAQTRVDIEFFSEGAIPAFTRNALEREIAKHLDLNPSKFQLTPQDEAEAKQLIESRGTTRQLAAVKRQMKLENAQAVASGSYRGLTSEKEQQTIHNMESVMGAYENFAKKITEDPDCGVPVGFNYTVLTQQMIERELGDGLNENNNNNNPARP